MASATPEKSILKLPSRPKPEPVDNEAATAQASKEKKNFDIALKHAYLIQHQKNIQAQILKNIERLLDFPSNASPTPADARDFLEQVAIFQPSDVDDLVEERRIDVKCGYPLCANKPRSYGLKDSEAWKLKKGAGDWCSNACARKALFVKTQLSEVPAWERVPGQQLEVRLHEDDRHLLPNAESQGDHGATEKVQQRVLELDELALERGERAVSFRPGQVMTDEIVEKKTEPKQEQTASRVKFASATAVEGYEPGTAASNKSSPTPLAPATIQPVGGGIAGEDSSSSSSDDGDEDEQWRDMFAHVRARENA